MRREDADAESRLSLSSSESRAVALRSVFAPGGALRVETELRWVQASTRWQPGPAAESSLRCVRDTDAQRVEPAPCQTSWRTKVQRFVLGGESSSRQHGWPHPTARLRPRNSAISLSPPRTVTSYIPERPRRARSSAVAVSTSPRRADSRKSKSNPAATVFTPRELQERANAESASAAIRPPWQRSCPLTMSSRTTMETRARPGDTDSMDMPSALLAASADHIASTCSLDASLLTTGRTQSRSCDRAHLLRPCPSGLEAV